MAVGVLLASQRLVGVGVGDYLALRDHHAAGRYPKDSSARRRIFGDPFDCSGEHKTVKTNTHDIYVVRKLHG